MHSTRHSLLLPVCLLAYAHLSPVDGNNIFSRKIDRTQWTTEKMCKKNTWEWKLVYTIHTVRCFIALILQIRSNMRQVRCKARTHCLYMQTLPPSALQIARCSQVQGNPFPTTTSFFFFARWIETSIMPGGEGHTQNKTVRSMYTTQQTQQKAGPVWPHWNCQ